MSQQRPLKLIVLTDLHMTPVGETIIGIDPGVRFADALAHVARYHRDADHLIITGDLTHYGDDAGYRRLSSLLAVTELPFTLLLGNHDRRETFVDAFPSAKVDQHGFVQSVADKGIWRLIFLDTLNVRPILTTRSMQATCVKRGSDGSTLRWHKPDSGQCCCSCIIRRMQSDSMAWTVFVCAMSRPSSMSWLATVTCGTYLLATFTARSVGRYAASHFRSSKARFTSNR